MRRPRHTRGKRKAPPRVAWNTLHHSKARGLVAGISRHYESTAAFRKTAERLDPEGKDDAAAG